MKNGTINSFQFDDLVEQFQKSNEAILRRSNSKFKKQLNYLSTLNSQKENWHPIIFYEKGLFDAQTNKAAETLFAEMKHYHTAQNLTSTQIIEILMTISTTRWENLCEAIACPEEERIENLLGLLVDGKNLCSKELIENLSRRGLLICENLLQTPRQPFAYNVENRNSYIPIEVCPYCVARQANPNSIFNNPCPEFIQTVEKLEEKHFAPYCIKLKVTKQDRISDESQLIIHDTLQLDDLTSEHTLKTVSHLVTHTGPDDPPINYNEEIIKIFKKFPGVKYRASFNAQPYVLGK